jgi:hypothetical protein
MIYPRGHGRTQDAGVRNNEPRFKAITRWEAVCRQSLGCLDYLWDTFCCLDDWSITLTASGQVSRILDVAGHFWAVKDCLTCYLPLEYSAGLSFKWINWFVTIQSSTLTLCYVTVCSAFQTMWPWKLQPLKQGGMWWHMLAIPVLEKQRIRSSRPVCDA